jgi:hypothetical protein
MELLLGSNFMRTPPGEISRRLAALALVGIVAALAGCASTRVEGQWRHPEAANVRLDGKVLVVGLTRDETTRRLFEDAMSAELAARGRTVVRSYEAADGALAAAGAEALAALAKRVGAASILSSALVAHEQVQRVTIEPMPEWRWSYSGWYGHYWPLATRTEVRTYDRYVASTSLTDVAAGRVIWTARTVTSSPGAAEREVKAFASVIAEALAGAGLLS